jgi:fido (protein-threonine AMPylation protein)
VTEETLYLYPGSPVLRNKLAIADKERLEQIERLFVVVNIRHRPDPSYA